MVRGGTSGEIEDRRRRYARSTARNRVECVQRARGSPYTRASRSWNSIVGGSGFYSTFVGEGNCYCRFFDKHYSSEVNCRGFVLNSCCEILYCPLETPPRFSARLSATPAAKLQFSTQNLRHTTSQCHKPSQSSRKCVSIPRRVQMYKPHLHLFLLNHH